MKGSRSSQAFFQAAATAARGDILRDLGAKHDGIYHLYYRLGNVLCSATRLGKVTEAIRAGRASEYANVALSSVKDNLFLNHCNALEFLASSLAYARLKYKLYEKSYGNRIESTIKANGINIDISPGNSRFLGANVARSFYNIIAHIGKVNANVLEAVAITARVKNSVRLYTNGLFSPTRSTA